MTRKKSVFVLEPKNLFLKLPSKRLAQPVTGFEELQVERLGFSHLALLRYVAMGGGGRDLT